MAVIVNGVPFTLFEDGLFRLLDAPLSPVSRYVTVKAEAVAELARQNVRANFRTRTGDLERSIGVFPRETAEGIVTEIGTEGAPYGLVLEQGSEPHPIFPVRTRFLASPPGHPDPLEDPKFRRQVNHPGTQGRPWLKPALETVFNGG